ncbi:MAG TPA: hypothetical protein VFU22_29305 [Roseiflexaceae bacterium]|nr:hypothetical protein [Roseiflexaceae bacterium]
MLFGVNAIGFVGASQLNRVFLRRLSLLAVTRGAVTAAVLIALLLLAVVASGHASTLTLTMLFFALSAAIGCIFPNIAALAFGSVRERMGSAAALQGTLQSVFGGVAGGLVGALGNGTPLPVLGIITGFAALAAVFLRAAHRRQLEAYNMSRTLLPDPGTEPR